MSARTNLLLQSNALSPRSDQIKPNSTTHNLIVPFIRNKPINQLCLFSHCTRIKEMASPSNFVAAAAARESFAHCAMAEGTNSNAQSNPPSGHSTGTSMRRRLDTPTGSTAARRHCHVQFSDEIQGILVPSLKDMPAEEKQHIWYMDEDKGHFKDDMMKDARLLRRCLSTGSSISPESECSTARGIEHLRSNATLHQLSDAKTKVIRSVLIEQHCQKTRYGHVIDPLEIALASSEHSLGAKKTAIAHALLDQEFVLASSFQSDHQLRYKSPQDERAHTVRSAGNPQSMMLMQHRASVIQQTQETATSRGGGGGSNSSSIARWSALRQGH